MQGGDGIMVERRQGGEGRGGILCCSKKSEFLLDTNKIQNGHQLKDHVIWIIGVEACCAAQLIVDILGRPIWRCDVGHCVAVLEIFVLPESVCIKSVM